MHTKSQLQEEDGGAFSAMKESPKSGNNDNDIIFVQCTNAVQNWPLLCSGPIEVKYNCWINYLSFNFHSYTEEVGAAIMTPSYKANELRLFFSSWLKINGSTGVFVLKKVNWYYGHLNYFDISSVPLHVELTLWMKIPNICGPYTWDALYFHQCPLCFIHGHGYASNFRDAKTWEKEERGDDDLRSSKACCLCASNTNTRFRDGKLKIFLPA